MDRSKLYSLFFLIFLAFATVGAQAQVGKGTLKGKIVTTEGKPADNVSVGLKNTPYGAVTGEDGTYVIKAPAGDYTLVASHIGRQAEEARVSVTAGGTTNVNTITINLKNSALQEVNVSGSKVNRFKRKQSENVAKMPLANLENAQSYTTISRELLTEQNMFTVDDALRNAPGIQKMWDATGRGGDGGGYFVLRGFATQTALRNGVSGLVTNTIDAFNLERIEVIKGPSATLYGSTKVTYGGLINRVTKKPYENFGGEVSYFGGSYGLNRATIDVNTPLNKDKTVLFRLNSAYNNQGSFQDAGFNKGWSFAPSLSIKASNRLSFLFDAELFYSRNALNTIYFFPYGVKLSDIGYTSADRLPIDYRKSYFSKDLNQRSVSTNYFGQMNYKISKEITSQTNYTYGYSFSNGFGPYFYLLPGNQIYRQDQSTQNSKQGITEVQQNFNGDFKIGGVRNRMVFGLDFTRINSDQHFLSDAFDIAPINSSTYNYSSFNAANMAAIYDKNSSTTFHYPVVAKSNIYSAYLSDVVNITDQLIASAAIRIDRFDYKGTEDASTGIASGGYKQTAFSPKFGLVYQVVKDKVSLFANYQNGFKNQAPDAKGNSFKPEQANQLEGGVKVDIIDGLLSGTVSYYDIQVKDIVRPDPTQPNVNIQNGTQLSRGVEAEVIANPLQGVNVVAGLAYNSSKLKDATFDVEGLRPVTAGSPFTANLWVSYRFQSLALKGLGIGAGGNYATDNKVVNSRTVAGGPVSTFTLPSYTVLNSTAFYDKGDYRIGLSVNNFTNQKWYTGYGTVNPQMLRQIIASFAFRF